MAKKKDPALEAERKHQIMLAAYQLLVEGSVQALTLDRVARASGISKGLVSYYFKGKERLVTETMHFILMEQKRRLLALAHQDKPVQGRVRELIAAALPSRGEVSDITSFLMETWSFAKNNPRTGRVVRGNYAEFRALCEELIALGIAAGYFKNINPKMFSLMIYSLFDGLALQITLDPSLNVVSIQEALFDFIERHLRAPSSQPLP